MPLFFKYVLMHIANSCEHNSSYSFQWMILAPSSIVTHGTQLCAQAGLFQLFIPNRGMPLICYYICFGRIMLRQAVFFVILFKTRFRSIFNINIQKRNNTLMVCFSALDKSVKICLLEDILNITCIYIVFIKCMCPISVLIYVCCYK